MPKFKYIGDESHVTVGISGARFAKNQINEVPDERLAAVLRNNEFFEEVAQADVPEYPAPVSLMPRQGDAHPDPRVSALLRGDTAEIQETTVGNLNREDQREANTASLAGKEAQANEAEEQPAASAPTEQPTPETARKRK